MKKIKDKDVLVYLKKALKLSPKKKISNKTQLIDIYEMDSFGWIMFAEYLDKKNLYLDIGKIGNIKEVKDLKKIIKSNN
mgnify:FL=1|tara:strand:+ start:163 stop:399 length:237 start_codon:yes stop_codon:yes gene_type:complete